MTLANVKGINLNYEIRGEGPKLLFIHGIGADLKNPISIFNSPLAAHFTILAFDPRGLGESDSPENPCTIQDMAEDAAGLAQAAGWDSYYVFGASMGGMVAQELAIHYPASVKKLVLGSTVAGGKNSSVVTADKLDIMSPRETLKTSDIRQDDAWAEAHPEIVARTEQQLTALKAQRQADAAVLRGYNYQVEASLKHDSFDRLPQIKAATLVFSGVYDGSILPKLAEELAGRIPKAQLRLVEHGHGSWFFDQSVWEFVIEFLKS